MSLAEQITADLTASMKARDAGTTGALRLILAEIRTLRGAEGRGGAEPTDPEVLELLARAAKQRREAAGTYRNADRPELAEQEDRELAVITRYLPAQLGEDEVRAAVAEAVAATGASGPGDLGTVMSAVMPTVKGRADGKLVNRLVREALAD